MRALAQFLIPILIVVLAVLWVTRRRPRDDGTEAGGAASQLSTPTLVLLIVVGALFTLTLVFMLLGSV